MEIKVNILAPSYLILQGSSWQMRLKCGWIYEHKWNILPLKTAGGLQVRLAWVNPS